MPTSKSPEPSDRINAESSLQFEVFRNPKPNVKNTQKIACKELKSNFTRLKFSDKPILEFVSK